MTTTWEDAEFASVAKALRYPCARDNVIVPGFPFDLIHQAWLLDRVLEHLDAGCKGEILSLAENVNAAERAKWESVACSPDVTKVGNIERDVAKGLRIRASVIDEMRARLSEMIPFAINPAAAPSGIGGIQGAVAC